MNSKETVEIEKSGFISTRMRETLDSIGSRVVGILGWGAAISAGAAVGTYSNEVSEVIGRIMSGVTLSSSGDFVDSFNGIKNSWNLISSGKIDEIAIGQLRQIFSFLKPLASIGTNLAEFKIIVLILSMYASYKLISFPGKTLISWLLLGNRARSEHKVRIFLSNLFFGKSSPGTAISIPPVLTHPSPVPPTHPTGPTAPAPTGTGIPVPPSPTGAPPPVSPTVVAPPVIVAAPTLGGSVIAARRKRR